VKRRASHNFSAGEILLLEHIVSHLEKRRGVRLPRQLATVADFAPLYRKILHMRGVVEAQRREEVVSELRTRRRRAAGKRVLRTAT
jgi:hypothetical protein